MILERFIGKFIYKFSCCLLMVVGKTLDPSIPKPSLRMTKRFMLLVVGKIKCNVEMTYIRDINFCWYLFCFNLTEIDEKSYNLSVNISNICRFLICD
jgi:hypothetical protein